MDEKKLRTAAIKQTRRLILSALGKVAEVPLSFECLRNVFPYVEVTDLRRDVTYLLGKKYLEEVYAAAGKEWDRRMFKITATGIEQSDEINLDPALEA